MGQHAWMRKNNYIYCWHLRVNFCIEFCLAKVIRTKWIISTGHDLSLRHSNLINLKLNKVWKTSCELSVIEIYDKHYLRAMLYHPEMTIYLDHITCLVIFLLRMFYYWLINRINSRSQEGMKVIDIRKDFISFE